MDNELLEYLVNLAQNLPTTRTELDVIWTEIFKYFFQLIVAVKKNIKKKYLSISSKLRKCLFNLLKSIETIEVEFENYPETLVRTKIKELSAMAASALPKKLMLSTKMSSGVWPLNDASERMIHEALAIVSISKETCDLANLIGMFPVLKDPSQSLFNSIEDFTLAEVEHVMKSEASFNEHQNQNDIIEMEELSQRYSLASSSGYSSSPDQQRVVFENILDELMIQFEAAISVLGASYSGTLEEIESAANSIQNIVEDLISNIESFDLIKFMSPTLEFSEDDIEILLNTGLEYGTTPFPINARIFLGNIINLSRKEVESIIKSSKWISNEIDSHLILFGCLETVKKLKSCASAVVLKQKRLTEYEKGQRDEWNRECLAKERVKSKFQAWEAMVLENGAEMSMMSSMASLNERNLEEQSIHDIIFDDSFKIIGGKLVNLVEYLTAHETSHDIEFLPVFLLTFHSFTTTPALLGMLMERYETSPSHLTSSSMYDIFVDKELVQIRLKVSVALLHWIKNHYAEDFQYFEFLCTQLRNFINNIVKTDFELLASQMLQIIDQKDSLSSSISLQKFNSGRVSLSAGFSDGKEDQPISPGISIKKSASAADKLRHTRKTSASSVGFSEQKEEHPPPVNTLTKSSSIIERPRNLRKTSLASIAFSDEKEKPAHTLSATMTMSGSIVENSRQSRKTSISEVQESDNSGPSSVVKSASVVERPKNSSRRPSLSSIATDLLQNLNVRRPSLTGFLSSPVDSSSYLDFDPFEFGKQLTLMEFDLYLKVSSYELLDQIWEGKILKEISSYPIVHPSHTKRNTGRSSMSKLIQHTNDVLILIVYFLGSNDGSESQISKKALHCIKVFHTGSQSNIANSLAETIIISLELQPSLLDCPWDL